MELVKIQSIYVDSKDTNPDVDYQEIEFPQTLEARDRKMIYNTAEEHKLIVTKVECEPSKTDTDDQQTDAKYLKVRINNVKLTHIKVFEDKDLKKFKIVEKSKRKKEQKLKESNADKDIPQV